jgi:UDP-2,4-diacetamido-2,4,6-trideoxy-beta-L-altropyranose hydrolase
MSTALSENSHPCWGSSSGDMRAILRFDQSAAIGAGHAMRCTALAVALRGFGVDCILVIGPDSDADVAGEFPVRRLEDAGAAGLRAAFPDGCDLLVVDSYRLDAAFETACRGWAGRILVLDDSPSRAHDCDVLLDQSPGRVAGDYARLVPVGTQILAGADHALLRASFRRSRHARAETADAPVFVGFGASDPSGLTGRAIAVASATGRRVCAVLGRMAPHAGDVRSRFAGNPHVDVQIDPADIATRMAECGIAIGAAGVSALERCCVGLASVTVPVADNQRDNAHALAAAGAAICVEPSPDHDFDARLAAAFGRLAADPGPIRQAALGICDGYGALRVAAALGGLAAKDGRPVAFRPVTSADCDALLGWQHLPSIRRYSRNPDPPSPDAHARWLAARLADPTRFFEIALLDGKPAGVVRLDRLPRQDGDAVPCYEVSVFVLPGAEGQGIGKAMLRQARAAVPWARLRAEVLEGNSASHALFSASGYRRVDGLYFNEAVGASQ